jgi:hypothetical protein
MTELEQQIDRLGQVALHLETNFQHLVHNYHHDWPPALPDEVRFIRADLERLKEIKHALTGLNAPSQKLTDATQRMVASMDKLTSLLKNSKQ